MVCRNLSERLYSKIIVSKSPYRQPLGEKGTGPNPTDRSKSGTKRSLLVDGKGVPLGVIVGGANEYDMKMTKATFRSIVIDRPEPTSS
jgi:putative transposase